MKVSSLFIIIFISLLIILSIGIPLITENKDFDTKSNSIQFHSREITFTTRQITNSTDTEPPIPRMKTDPSNRICFIDKWIILNASLTTDNNDSVENLIFRWDLDIFADSNSDGMYHNDVDAVGPIVNFTPKRIGPNYIVLWIADQSGNIANTSEEPIENWIIDVVGVDLRFPPVEEINPKEFIKISNDNPTKGEKVKYILNLTNDGFMTAWDVIVRFYVNNEEKDHININRIDEDEYINIKFSWKAESEGIQDIKFNVSLENYANHTYEMFWDNNEKLTSIEVQKDEGIGFLPGFEIIVILIGLGIVFVLSNNHKGRN